jgi:hypothetical protein
MTGTVGFREATRADRDSILDLRALVFANDDPEKQRPDFWEWEFREGYAGPGRIFVAEHDDRIVGHLAFIPQQYAAGTTRIDGALAVDVMTDPQVRRQKIFSRLARFAAERLRRDFQVITAFQIRKEVAGGMLAGGWRPAGELPVMLKPLSMTRIVRDFVSSAQAQPTASAAIEREGPIRLIADGEFDGIDALLETTHPRQMRTGDFLRWRYRRNPHWHYRMEGLFEEGTLRAFVVHRPAVLKGRRTLAIAEAGCERGRESSLQHLVRHVCATHGKGSGLAAALISRQHPAYSALRKSGFIPGPHRFRLLVQVFDEKLRDLDATPWSLSWGDTDHL